MEEILYELREHASGLNAGRWDYLFSTIKTLRNRQDLVLPDRAQLTMTVPFMRAYTELLVATCHRRGAHAMGGMAAFIPSRKDPAINGGRAGEGPRGQAARVARRLRRDLGGAPRPRPGREGGLRAGARQTGQPEGAAARGRASRTAGQARRHARRRAAKVTEAGFRNNVNVALQYLELLALRGTAPRRSSTSWRTSRPRRSPGRSSGSGSHNGARLDDGRPVTAALYDQVRDEELAAARGGAGRRAPARGGGDPGRRSSRAAEFPEFLTLPAYRVPRSRRHAPARLMTAPAPAVPSRASPREIAAVVGRAQLLHAIRRSCAPTSATG